MNRQLEDELRKYAKLCDDEVGEYSNLLCALNSYTWCMGKEFKAIYEKEFIEQLEHFRKNSKIVKSHIINEYDVEELVWESDE